MNRRSFLKGIAGGAGGLILPPAPERRFWSLDRTMLSPPPTIPYIIMHRDFEAELLERGIDPVSYVREMTGRLLSSRVDNPSYVEFHSEVRYDKWERFVKNSPLLAGSWSSGPPSGLAEDDIGLRFGLDLNR